MSKPRLIAYYLPQYHPIPENDAWWGEGFTEWTNVRKAKPLFRGHQQPVEPGELGYYDLRNPEIRERQAEMAREAGIEGFCYWHYWFGGKQLLERPFTEVLSSGKPDFPFCLAWANHSWTGIWFGEPDRILMEQTYPGVEDHVAHFNSLLPAFRDPRYLRVDDRPIFFVFQPANLDADWVELWRNLAEKAGLPGLWLVGIVKNASEALQIRTIGFDACTVSRTAGRGTRLPALQNFMKKLLGERKAVAVYQRLFRKPFHIYRYADALPFIDLVAPPGMDFYPAVIPGWDNTPRSGINGQVFVESSPEIFREHLQKASERVSVYPEDHQLIIIKSWNEWAEGNYLEPDKKNGHAFLNTVKKFISGYGEGSPHDG